MEPLPPNHRLEKADELTADQASTFLDRGAVQAVMIHAGQSIWRFVTSKHANPFSEYWLQPEAMRHLMMTFHEWGDFSNSTKTSVVQNNLAILNDWNSLNWRCRITLTQSVVGYRGQTGPQKIFAGNDVQTQLTGLPTANIKEFRLGGLKQIVIPRFRNMKQSEGEAKWGKVTYLARFADRPIPPRGQTVMLSDIETVPETALTPSRLHLLQHGFSPFITVLNSAQDPITLERGTKPLRIVDGRHRIFLARRMGLQKIQAKLI